METTQTFLIECSRENAENYEETIAVTRGKNENNARWTNNVLFNFEPGDEVNMEYSGIHAIGADAESVIEITGRNDPQNNLTDNIVGFKFSSYICNNGYNAVKLPFVKFTNSAYTHENGNGELSGQGQGKHGNLNGYNTPMQYLINNIAYVAGSNNQLVTARYGQPSTQNGNFEFNYTEGADTDQIYGYSPRTCRSGYALPIAFNNETMDFTNNGKKYTLLSHDYSGPYRDNVNNETDQYGSDQTNTGGTATFNSAPDLNFAQDDVIIKIDAPIYEAPSTICNKINTELHKTIPIDENINASIIPINQQTGLPYPNVRGPLMKAIRANGVRDEDSGYGTNLKRLWGQIAVEDINKWKAIHKIMRCSLAFNGRFKIAQNSPDEFQSTRPIILWSGRGCSQRYKTTYQGSNTDNNLTGIRIFAPRTMKQFTYNWSSDGAETSYENTSSNLGHGDPYGGGIDPLWPIFNVGDTFTTMDGGHQGKVTEVASSGIDGDDGVYPKKFTMISSNFFDWWNSNYKGGSGINTDLQVRIKKDGTSGTTEQIANMGGPLIQQGDTSTGTNNEAIAYSLLPQYFLVQTNIKYTDNNAKILRDWFSYTEKYDGTETNMDRINADTENWYQECDLGRSMDSTAGLGDSTTYPDKYGSANMPFAYNNLLLTRGLFKMNNTPTTDNDYANRLSYAFALPDDPYSIRTKVDGFGKCPTAPRIDIPKVGYKYYDASIDSGQDNHPANLLYNLDSIGTDVPHRFRDNKLKNANMAVYSKFLTDWKDKIRFNNFPDKAANIGDFNYEGVGKIGHTPPSIDETLGKKYGIGIYGYDNYPNAGEGGTFIKIFGSVIKEDVGADNQAIMFMNKVTPSVPGFSGDSVGYYTGGVMAFVDANNFYDNGLIPDQKIHGGVGVLVYINQHPQSVGNEADFSTQTYIYVYSAFNQNYKDATHDPAGKTYNGGTAIDMTNENIIYIVRESTGDGSLDDVTICFVGVIAAAYDDGKYKDISLYVIDQDSKYDTQDQYHQLFPFGIQSNPNEGFSGNRKVDGMRVVIDKHSDPFNIVQSFGDFTDPKESIDSWSEVPMTQQTDSSEQCVGFLLYNDSFKWNNNNEPEIDTDFALPSIYSGLEFGGSPSFMDNPAIWFLNPMINNTAKNGDKDSTGYSAESAQNFIMCGANDPTCEFDASLSRATFFNLHTQRLLGIGECPGADIADDSTTGPATIVETNLGEPIVKFNDTSFFFSQWTDFTTQKDGSNTKYVQSINKANVGRSTSTAGVSIETLYGISEKGKTINNLILDDMKEIDSDTGFYNSLLYKLGFSYGDFFPDFGLPYSWHDPTVQGSNIPDERYKSTKPISTNANLTISEMPDMSLTDAFARPNTSCAGKPNYQLGGPGQDEFNLDGSVSTQVRASNLPIKADTSFYTVYSDICQNNYYSQGLKKQIIGVIPKNYISADFIYGFASTYRQPITFPKKLRSVTTEIRLPNGKLAPIDPKSSIIYKVTRKFFIPDAVQLEEEIIQDEMAEQKKENVKQ